MVIACCAPRLPAQFSSAEPDGVDDQGNLMPPSTGALTCDITLAMTAQPPPVAGMGAEEPDLAAAASGSSAEPTGLAAAGEALLPAPAAARHVAAAGGSAGGAGEHASSSGGSGKPMFSAAEVPGNPQMRRRAEAACARDWPGGADMLDTALQCVFYPRDWCMHAAQGIAVVCAGEP